MARSAKVSIGDNNNERSVSGVNSDRRQAAMVSTGPSDAQVVVRENKAHLVPAVRQAVNQAHLDLSIAQRKAPEGPFPPPPGMDQQMWERAKRHYMDGKFKLDEPDTPIEFYGKVIDQDEKGVPGVAIKLKITANAPQFYEKYGTSELESLLSTDERGMFSIKGVSGQNLRVLSVAKPGYDVRSFTPVYDYATVKSGRIKHIPDPNKPVVYYTWRITKSEPLIKRSISKKVTFDGEPHTVDLLKGKIVKGVQPGGDFVVRMSPLSSTAERRYSWICSVDVPGGGVVPSDDKFLYRAPEAGYLPHWERTVSMSDPDWNSVKVLNCYIQSRGNRAYSGVSIEFITHPPLGALLCVSYLFNPAGSRNLEYDASLKINNDE
jgi:hypothetical protein